MSTQDDPLEIAVNALLDKIRQQDEAVRKTKTIVNTLLSQMGKAPMFEDVDKQATPTKNIVSRPDQFYGRPLATVTKEILNSRGQAMAATEIIEILEKGGYDFTLHDWKEKDRLRLFSLTLAKNTTAFHRLPNGFFGLPQWYPEAISRRQSSKADRDNGSTESGSSADAAPTATVAAEAEDLLKEE